MPVRAVLRALLPPVAALALAGVLTSAPAAGATSHVGATSGPPVSWSLTTGDQGSLLAPQPALTFGADKATSGAVTVDDTVHAQPFEGVGAALTESSAELLSTLPDASRAGLLRALFDPSSGAGISVLRIPLGASDFALGDYTYDDLPSGATDETLASFSMDRERRYVLPVLEEAMSYNPSLEVVLTPWSAPAWMKTTGSTHGGGLLPQEEQVYADYLARTVAWFSAAGVRVRALTLANEPENSTTSYPSMTMTADQEQRVAGLVRADLDAAGEASTGIVAYDHNWDDVAYPTAALSGAAGAALEGAAFHCYAGDVSAQSSFAAAVPTASVWTTECSGGSWSTSWSGDLRWGVRNMDIGAFRNHSVGSLWWNLALDPQGGPTNGGCQNCRGVVTVDPAAGTSTFNVEYWELAHLGRFVPRGSVRVGTPERTAAGIESVAFTTPRGGTVLLLLNDSGSRQSVRIRWHGMSTVAVVPAGAVATLNW